MPKIKRCLIAIALILGSGVSVFAANPSNSEYWWLHTPIPGWEIENLVMLNMETTDNGGWNARRAHMTVFRFRFRDGVECVLIPDPAIACNWAR